MVTEVPLCIKPNLEQTLRQRKHLLAIFPVWVLSEILKVAAVVKNLESALVLSGAIDVLAQSGASADHLNELDFRPHFLEEYQIEHGGNIHTGIQHINGNRNAEFIVFFKFQNQIIAVVHGIVHQLAGIGRILRIQFLEAIYNHLSVLMVVGENDGLAKGFASVDTISR